MDSVVSILKIDFHRRCLFFPLESFVHVICKSSRIFLATTRFNSSATVFCIVKMWYPFILWWSLPVGNMSHEAVCPVFGNTAFAEAFSVDGVHLTPVLFCMFLVSVYRILSGAGAVFFRLLLRASMNSSSLSSLSVPLCACVLLRSVHASFLLCCFGCSGV